MTNEMLDKILSKQILQIRFKPSIAWLGARSEVASLLEDKYDEWRPTTEGNIALYSPDKKQALEVFTQNFTYVDESDGGLQSGITQILSLFSALSDSFNVDETSRIGYRQTLIFESPLEFEEVVDLLDRKLFSQSEEMKQLKGDSVSDSIFVLETLHSNISNHIQIGAVKRDQGKAMFATNFKLGEELSKDGNIFVDIDSAVIDGTSASDLKDAIDNLVTFNKETLSTYIEYLSKG